MKNWEKVENLLKCFKCGCQLTFGNNNFRCNHCKAIYPIVDGIPRFVPENFWKLGDDNSSIQEKTKNYFGFEWDYFNDWGFIEDTEENLNNVELYGGLVAHRKAAFASKCRMTQDDLKLGNIILDAGCGNGRYTYEAGLNANGFVIGVDIGYGSVKSAFNNCKDLDNVFIIQASLFELPFKDNVIDSCFSNGVLMHTGNAKNAFMEIARTIKPEGCFVAHLYRKLNFVWEINDYMIRFITTKLSIEHNLKFAKIMAKLSKKINKFNRGFKRINLFLRLQPTVHHMFDWYSAPIATHHTDSELRYWFKQANFEVLDKPGKKYKWNHIPWAVNVKGRKIK